MHFAIIIKRDRYLQYVIRNSNSRALFHTSLKLSTRLYARNDRVTIIRLFEIIFLQLCAARLSYAALAIAQKYRTDIELLSLYASYHLINHYYVCYINKNLRNGRRVSNCLS